MKALIQLIAGSLAGVEKFDFYSFGDQVFQTRFEAAVAALEGKTVGELWNFIQDFKKKGGKFQSGHSQGSNKKSLLLHIATKCGVPVPGPGGLTCSRLSSFHYYLGVGFLVLLLGLNGFVFNL